ncbi:MAG: hypothetical protein J5J00_06110 [Deltaproteobacteria bacterium]|nr:hypothetical protein [Deltaproteobacteria bacterium]
MITKFNRLIVVLLVVAVALYFVLLNNSQITVYLYPGSPISANAGAILLAVFALGMLFMALIALWFGMKSYFRERGLIAKDRQRQAFYQGMIKARSYAATAEWVKAKEHWESVIKKDPTDIIARIELSRTLEELAREGSCEMIEALRVLDAARAADPSNSEVLARAAELNLALNNKTAALDNLNLMLYHHPNAKSALLARNVAEDLGRIDDAFEYQRRLEALSVNTNHAEITARLSFKKLLLEHSTDQESLRAQLKQFIKKNPEHAPALTKLAEIEAASGKLDEAAQLYLKASKSSGDSQAWHLAARHWLKANLPDKAIAAAKLTTGETSGEARIRAEMELIRLYLALNMLEEARQHLDGFPFLLKRENVKRGRDLMALYLSLKGLCLSRMGEYQHSSDIFKKLCEQEPELQDFIKDVEHAPSTEAPAPRLSTP